MESPKGFLLSCDHLGMVSKEQDGEQQRQDEGLRYEHHAEAGNNVKK